MFKSIEFFHQIRFFIGFFVCFGIWPCWQKDRFKYALIAYSLFSISLVFGIFASAFFVHNIIEENSLTSVIAYSFLLSILTTHLIITFEALFNRSAQMQLITKFDYIDNLFSSRLRVKISYNREKRALFVRIVIYVLIIFAIKSALVAYNLQFKNETSDFWYHNFYSIWIVRLRCIQVIFFVHLLRNRVQLLNDKMVEMLTVNSWHFTNRNKTESKIEVLVLNDVDPMKAFYDQLYHIKHIYGELYDICRIISSIFGWSLIAIVTQCFIDFVSNSYWTFRALEEVFMGFYNCVDCILLVVSIILTLGTLAYYCASCSHQVCTFLSLR